jgi:hypothetical protein
MTGKRRISDITYSADGKRILSQREPDSNTIIGSDGKRILSERRANKSITYGGDGHIISEE